MLIINLFMQVRNEAAEDFLSLLKEWEKLCKDFGLVGSQRAEDSGSKSEESDSEEIEEDRDPNDGEFEVAKLIAVCYGDPNKPKTKKPAKNLTKKLHFKVLYFIFNLQLIIMF